MFGFAKLERNVKVDVRSTHSYKKIARSLYNWPIQKTKRKKVEDDITIEMKRLGTEKRLQLLYNNLMKVKGNTIVFLTLTTYTFEMFR